MTAVAGIAVGKTDLDVSGSGGPVVSSDNTTPGITKLIKHLNDHDTALARFEPTGSYERLLTSRLHQSEIAVQVVHPGRVRAFAKACGYEAKIDQLDAPVLARYGEVFTEADTWEPETDLHRQEPKDLLRRRRQFIDQRVQEKGRLDKGISTTIARSTKRHIAWMEKEIARLDNEYQAVLKDNPTLAELADLYRTVPGVGPLTAATLVAHLPVLGHWNSKALTSLVGLAPWSRGSGKERGYRTIRGDRRQVWRTLYVCAWSVIRHDSEMRRKPAIRPHSSVAVHDAICRVNGSVIELGLNLIAQFLLRQHYQGAACPTHADIGVSARVLLIERAGGIGAIVRQTPQNQNDHFILHALEGRYGAKFQARGPVVELTSLPSDVGDQAMPPVIPIQVQAAIF